MQIGFESAIFIRGMEKGSAEPGDFGRSDGFRCQISRRPAGKPGRFCYSTGGGGPTAVRPVF